MHKLTELQVSTIEAETLDFPLTPLQELNGLVRGLASITNDYTRYLDRGEPACREKHKQEYEQAIARTASEHIERQLVEVNRALVHFKKHWGVSIDA